MGKKSNHIIHLPKEDTTQYVFPTNDTSQTSKYSNYRKCETIGCGKSYVYIKNHQKGLKKQFRRRCNSCRETIKANISLSECF